ncbi:Precorrin-6x reductase OS=Tsukamurella paurometabola (strain ATCC 8368 / DSM / CCUG 35730 /CIP 100753 / JCM 10117 / KCTC 9821 / NBRC 16120 / NCIMB 702349/ NCTC 13040) OX=521096 GN=Tpau_2180 PE=4 SV=1 [Tsukamurella paurometabola]|uniref:Precorrin-6x reductase n=1 Tax=Tsukamurella paurometabola (strain ATCC 8368 / DSM 20162 / CCUG 35730 / CIP 100753 / JCM 10117 / KCTC 9821 / NBRC 16120 / NCIMB 702349 / NCTC 13040) TaxID=521096 RepID=D5UPN4_TSUPD|nr:cobalt-precorrin-6A reductase [Tsukamurella paurometabola]ADG78790.1 precorrin-6x reductase [Tsukamurella paurometabola DSM 20162]SUP33158.1 Precorrin-6A reductase [Tsukamurella paurometabola]
MTGRPIRVLILGGTAEARELAQLLDEDDDFAVLSSLAGRVANPRLPVGQTRIGGFGGVDGLTAFLSGIDVLVDATHPFAATISRHAAAAAQRTGTPVFAVVRPQWSAAPGDRWTRVPTVAAAATELSARRGGTAFLTTGRQDVHAFAALDAWRFLIRVVDTPAGSLPKRHTLIHDRGPYLIGAETALLRENAVDVLVTKNSGGDLVSAKLEAARMLGVEVVMVDRPPRPGVPTEPSAASAHARLRADL